MSFLRNSHTHVALTTLAVRVSNGLVDGQLSLRWSCGRERRPPPAPSTKPQDKEAAQAATSTAEELTVDAVIPKRRHRRSHFSAHTNLRFCKLIGRSCQGDTLKRRATGTTNQIVIRGSLPFCHASITNICSKPSANSISPDITGKSTPLALDIVSTQKTSALPLQTDFDPFETTFVRGNPTFPVLPAPVQFNHWRFLLGRPQKLRGVSSPRRALSTGLPNDSQRGAITKPACNKQCGRSPDYLARVTLLCAHLIAGQL